MTEHCIKEVHVNTRPKAWFTIVVSDSSASIQTPFNPPLYLEANRDYELAMVNQETYYSFANIRGDINTFKWSTDDGNSWTALSVHTGCYELNVINAEIIRILGNSDITILPNINTLQCILTVDKECKVMIGGRRIQGKRGAKGYSEPGSRGHIGERGPTGDKGEARPCWFAWSYRLEM